MVSHWTLGSWLDKVVLSFPCKVFIFSGLKSKCSNKSMLTSLICDSSDETGQYNSFISRCVYSFLLNHVVFPWHMRCYCITIIIWFLVCYYIIVMWYMLKKQIQSLDLLINSCKENPLCDVISPVCPETYGKQGCFISTWNCRITSSIRLTSWQLGGGGGGGSVEVVILW